MKYHLVVLGCQMNISDSERFRSLLNSVGFEETDKEEDANLLGIIACSVRQKAIDKVYSRINLWNKWKKERHLMTFASGCLLPKDTSKLLKLFDFVFETKDVANLPDMIRQYGLSNPSIINMHDSTQEEFWSLSPIQKSKIDSFLPIQNGCNKFCSYCAVPYTRGREESRPSQEIIEEFEKFLNTGSKTVTLLGQNVNSYGLDKKGEEISFAKLLSKLGEIADNSKKEIRIYFTSPHPSDMTDDVLDAMAKYNSIAKQIHLPLQAGDEEILRRMNRPYNLDRFASIVDSIREKMPEATIFTDIIVGFPGESEEAFNMSIEAMKRFKFNMAYIACYSPRPGAVSFKWEDDIPQAEKKRRLHRLGEELKITAQDFNKRYVGKKVRVLVDGESRDGKRFSGKTEGLVTIQWPKHNDIKLGDFVDIYVENIESLSLKGEYRP